MMTITKNEFVNFVLDNSDLSKIESMSFVEDFFGLIAQTLEEGKEVKIAGFGNFVLKDKNARVGRNPKTGEEFPILARTVVGFHPSNILKKNLTQEKQ